MTIIMSKFSNRDKAILIGLYLSKFDRYGLAALGFEGFHQAFNVMGYTLGCKPASIKNYRDEFDPYFVNPRQGWHKRAIRDYCKVFIDDFRSLAFNEFTELIKSFVIRDYDIEKLIDKVEKVDRSESVSKRLVTGNAAEGYFRMNYSSINEFQDFQLQDTTYLACGFDFRLSLATDFFCIEVKGLNANTGSLSLTEKEYKVANEFKERYCLFVVMNFIEKPYHRLLFDPLNNILNFKKTERIVTQISYNASL